MIENSYKDAKQLGPGEYRFRMRSRLCALDWELEKADTKYKRNRDMERH
ncbi:MAG: hypothetical protein WAK17_05655 [Candidatus Nitrosopolaris sp.]